MRYVLVPHYDYLLLPRVEVQSANAVSSYWTISPEVVVAARQMAHALARRIGVVDQEAGVAIIHHDVEILGEILPGGWAFSPHQRRGAAFIDRNDYPPGSQSLSMQPTASMHITVTLVIRFLAGAALDIDKISRFLDMGRLAGGQIVGFRKPQLFQNLSDLLKVIRTGFVVVERADLLDDSEDTDNESSSDMVDRFLRALYPVRDDQLEKADAARTGPSRPWLVPATLGYVMIGSPKHRNGAREGYPAVYAEAVVGLIEFVPMRRVREANTLPFWDYDYSSEGTLAVTQRTEFDGVGGNQNGSAE